VNENLSQMQEELAEQLEQFRDNCMRWKKYRSLENGYRTNSSTALPSQHMHFIVC